MTTKAPSLKTLRSEGKIGSRDLYQIDIRDFIVIPGNSGRDEDREGFAESIDQLEEYLENGGTVPPMEFKLNSEGQPVVVQGHRRRLSFLRVLPRRVAAAIAEGMDPVKAEKLYRVDALPFTGNDVDQVARIVSGNEHLPLTDLEKGRQFARLRDEFKLNVADICRKTGAPRFRVETCLTLVDANHDVHEALKDGTVKATVAAKLVKQHGEKAGEKIKELSEEAKAKGKKRVTDGAMKPKPKAKSMSVPKGIALDLGERVNNLIAKLPERTRVTLDEYRKDPDQYDPDESVFVPLALLAGLQAAHQNLLDKQKPAEDDDL